MVGRRKRRVSRMIGCKSWLWLPSALPGHTLIWTEFQVQTPGLPGAPPTTRLIPETSPDQTVTTWSATPEDTNHVVGQTERQ